METAALAAFTITLIASIAAGIPIIAALIAGYAIFFIYARLCGFSVRSIIRMSSVGVKEIRNILATFVLIGMLTASWRGAATIPSIVYCSFNAISPSWFLPAAFIINSLVSFLTGTSFGSAATIGVISMTAGNALGLSPVLTGGAVMSGIFFGDRCSPVSTSALLIADITKTDFFDNIARMMRSALVPFILSLLLYAAIGAISPHAEGDQGSLLHLFSEGFAIGVIPLIPAAIMLILSLFRVGTKRTMAASIASAALVCLLYEGMEPSRLIAMLVLGYRAQSPELAAVMDGGGIASMIEVGLIVTISASYAGIFQETGLLDSIKRMIGSAAERVPLSFVTGGVSIATCMIACNQTLAAMLTNQLCSDLWNDDSSMALALENTVIVIAPLIPWSIAGSVPLAVIGAPLSSLAAAFYLYLIPLYWMIAAAVGSRRRRVV